MSSSLPFSRIEGDWSGKPVYIIGGGPSLNGVDLSGLDGIRLGCNKAAWVACCPNLGTDCEAMFSLDQHFVRVYRDDISAYVARGGEAILAMPPNENRHTPIPGATYVYRRRNPGMSRKREDIFGTNSGYGALGVAYLKGAREIALLGFDFKYHEGRSHHHSGYSWHSHHSTERFRRKWAKNFDMAQAILKDAGVHVINFTGPGGSLLDAFETRPLDDLV